MTSPRKRKTIGKGVKWEGKEREKTFLSSHKLRIGIEKKKAAKRKEMGKKIQLKKRRKKKRDGNVKKE